MRKFAPFMLLVALLQNAGAQRMTLHVAPHGSQQFPQRVFSHAFLYPVPFFSDALYSEAAYPPGYPPAQPVIVMQAPPAAEPTAPVATPAEPLLIELQGDHYVRLSGGEVSGAEMIDKESAVAGKPLTIADGSYPVREPASTILVFRDGHHEEVSDYTITAGALYVRGNYYTDGSWSRKIDLSLLNLPGTVAANRSRGLNFLLPRAPNEVIVGP